MFLSSETLTALISLGAPPEKLAEVLRMIERDAESVQPRRSSGAERTRKWRESRHEASQNVTERHETSQASHSLSLSPSPQTPQPHTHTHGDIYTPRAKAGPKVDGFEAFWAAYPRKVAKDAARKAFSKALGRITEDDPLAVILAGVERALPGWPDPDFIPHPATWLNAGRWGDEAPPIRPAVNPTRPSHDRPRPSSRTEHLDGIARAMEAACQPDFYPARDPWEPGDGGGMRALPSAA